MIALDTNAVSEVTRPQPEQAVASWLDTLPKEQVFLPSVVVGELLTGLELMPQGKRRDMIAAVVLSFIASVPARNILDFGFAEAEQYALILSARQKIGRPIAIIDAQVAASAAVLGLPVATRNVRDFEHCGIRVVNPWEHT